ncbi:ABC transporter ATPase, partial [Escherichia coli]
MYKHPMKIFEKGKIMINYQLLETTFFKEAKQLAEVF